MKKLALATVILFTGLGVVSKSANGGAWSALGSGTNGTVSELECDGAGNLYAGGGFTVAGG